MEEGAESSQTNSEDKKFAGELQEKMESLLERAKEVYNPKFRTKLRNLRSLLEPIPCGSMGSTQQGLDWPPFEQLLSTASFEEPSPIKGVEGTREGNNRSSDNEALPALGNVEECGGDQWVVPPHLLKPRSQEAPCPQRHQSTINGVCVLALENAAKAGRKLHVLTINPKLPEEFKGGVMRVLLEQQRLHEAVTKTAHFNNYQGRRIMATQNLVAGGSSIGQTTLDVDGDTLT
jgi:hypothetical protein